MWGIIPATRDSRSQPIARSREPVAGRGAPDAARERITVCEQLVARMVRAGATRICFVLSPDRLDLVGQPGTTAGVARTCFVVQPEAGGFCHAVFQALPLVHADDEVLIGIPDTLWFPENGLAQLPKGVLSLLLCPVRRDRGTDAVMTDDLGWLRGIQPGSAEAGDWTWGAIRTPARVLQELHALWTRRLPRDDAFGPLLNAYLARGGRARALRSGTSLVHTGTPDGLREALRQLARESRRERQVPLVPQLELVRVPDGPTRGDDAAPAPRL